MNTVKSVYYGYAALIAAGGGAYIFAKRSINADRAAKAQVDREKRIALFQLEQQHFNHPSSESSESSQSRTAQLQAVAPPTPGQNGAGSGLAGSPGYGGGRGSGGDEQTGNPSAQAGYDPAPTRHEPVDEAGQAREKSKYEASDVYRRKKGDRLS
ncbi:hypothetical protein BDU57DRAFT_511297 [Ampelomyces quisqualis]|uniref:Uncharacterized protein n=1 Tax=Ampelomyces quisqualis TaxID=50730 RepID=A0A6A5QT62_AMPQU|nr:hypothetical protein BDU57DRAFT_511297 [Ampelomyces quisqualis]